MDFLTNTQRTFTWNTWNFWLRLFIVYFGLVPHIYVAGMPNTNRYRWQIFLCPAEICDTVFQVFSKAGSCWERTPTILARGIHQTFHLVLLCWSFRIVSCGNSDNNCLIFKAILENSLPGELQVVSHWKGSRFVFSRASSKFTSSRDSTAADQNQECTYSCSYYSYL